MTREIIDLYKSGVGRGLAGSAGLQLVKHRGPIQGKYRARKRRFRLQDVVKKQVTSMYLKVEHRMSLGRRPCPSRGMP